MIQPADLAELVATALALAEQRRDRRVGWSIVGLEDMFLR